MGVDLELLAEGLVDCDRVLAAHPRIHAVYKPRSRGLLAELSLLQHATLWRITTVKRLAMPDWGGSDESMAECRAIVEAVRALTVGELWVGGDCGQAPFVEVTDELLARWMS